MIHASGDSACSDHALTHVTGDPAEQSDMRQVIPGGEDEQADQQGESGARAVFLRTRRQRTPAQDLGEKEQQVAPVQDGDGKQVDQREIHRQHRDERDEAGGAKLRHLARQLRDAQRPAEFVGAVM